MRVCVLVVALVFASATAAMAQNKGGGVKIGVNFADLNVDTDEDFRRPRIAAPGSLLAVFYVFPIAPHFAFQPEWLYAQKGAKLTIRKLGLRAQISSTITTSRCCCAGIRRPPGHRRSTCSADPHSTSAIARVRKTRTGTGHP